MVQVWIGRATLARSSHISSRVSTKVTRSHTTPRSPFLEASAFPNQMSEPWWASSSSQTWDDDRRNGSWQQRMQESPTDKKDKEQDRDRFENVTSLGAPSKHPLPLEDRRSLLVAVVNLLSPH